MRPQDRTRALLRSQLEPSMRLMLIAFADHMNASDTCFVGPETVRDETGLALSTVALLIAGAERAGILVRASGGHKSKDARICWDAVAAFVPVKTRRGGVRVKGSKQPIIGENQPNIGCHATTEHRLSHNRTSVEPQPNIGFLTTDNRTLSDHEATNEAIMEAPNAGAREGRPWPVKPAAAPAELHERPRYSPPREPPIPDDIDGLVTMLQHEQSGTDTARRMLQAGITTLAQLRGMTYDRLQYTPGIGPGRADQVQRALRLRGLDIAPPQPRQGAPPRRNIGLDILESLETISQDPKEST